MYTERSEAERSHGTKTIEGWEGTPPLVDSIQQYTKLWGPKSPWFKECVKATAKMCAWENLPLHLWEAAKFHGFHEDCGPKISKNQGEGV